jgi:hypothetical protein
MMFSPLHLPAQMAMLPERTGEFAAEFRNRRSPADHI